MWAHRLPFGEPHSAGGRAPVVLWAVTALIAFIRLFAGAHVHLTEDEAYYRIWSMAPAFGDYDHPPMVAWWIWLGRHAIGDTALGVRLLPILSGVLTSFLVFDLAALLGASPTTAERAGLWFNAMPLPLAGGFLAVPDAPASLFWLTTLVCVLRAVKFSSWRWWAAAGLAGGLASLSKYSALFLAPGVFTWLISTPTLRAQLGRPGPWLAFMIAAGLFGLNVDWNAHHDWLTFHKQFGRITPHQFAPRYLAELLIGQILLINPFIAVFVAKAVTPSTWRGRPSTLAIAPLIATSAPFAVYLVVHSLHDRVQAHWPAPIYPALAVCAAAAAERLIARRPWRDFALAAPITAAAITGAAFVGGVVLSDRWWVVGELTAPLRGWPTFAARLETVRRQSGAAWIGTLSYGVAAQLADERALRAPVLQLTERERWTALALGQTIDFSKPGLVVDLGRRAGRAHLSRCFGRVRPLGAFSRTDAASPNTAYTIIYVAHPLRNITRDGCEG